MDLHEPPRKSQSEESGLVMSERQRGMREQARENHPGERHIDHSQQRTSKRPNFSAPSGGPNEEPKCPAHNIPGCTDPRCQNN